MNERFMELTSFRPLFMVMCLAFWCIPLMCNGNDIVPEEACELGAENCQLKSTEDAMNMIMLGKNRGKQNVNEGSSFEIMDGDWIDLQPAPEGLVDVTLGEKAKKLTFLGHAMRKLDTKGEDKLSPEAAKCLEIALETAEKMEDGNDYIKDTTMSADEKEWLDHSKLHEADGDTSADALYKHLGILAALEAYDAKVSPEEAVKKGCVITGGIWDELIGVPDTPERAPDAKGCVQGDMCASTPKEAALLQEAVETGTLHSALQLWPDSGNIPFCIQKSFPAAGRQAMIDAMQHFKDRVPCIGFKEIQVLRDYDQSCTEDGHSKTTAIYVGMYDSGCYNIVGYTPQSQINLSPPCHNMGTAAHELGHALGMYHEMSRADVGKYVQILWDNIEEDRSTRFQFEFQADASTAEPYDLMSLMHYANGAGGKIIGVGRDRRQLPTMKAIGKEVSVMGNKMGLTKNDALQLGNMYKCAEQVKNFKMCTNDPKQCTKEACGCLQIASQEVTLYKDEDKDGCKRCLTRCPNWNRGTTRPCGCPLGMTKGSVEQNSRTLYFCKGSPIPAKPTPAPTPPAVPTRPPKPTTPKPTTPQPTTTQQTTGGKCEDKAWFCPYYIDKSWQCTPGSMVNGMPVLEVCFKTCGCPTCLDESALSCSMYKRYCNNPYARLGGKSVRDFCPQTCGKC